MSANPSRARPWAVALILLLVGALSGCATNGGRDPLEPLNRTIYSFNDTVDTIVLKPIAQGYQAVLPQIAQTGVRNFFSNLNEITVVINDLLQLKIPQAVNDAGRFLINSTVGVLGFFDVATHFGLEQHIEDFGQTLGYWGVESGPYLVLPFFGPSSVRDGLGRIVDSQTDVVWQIEDTSARNILLGTRAVSARAALLDSEKILDTAALDRYSFIREAYIQRRRSLVHDGNPPPELDEDFTKPAEPRSEQPPEPVTLLIDQYGGIVAAPSSGGVVAAPATGVAAVSASDCIDAVPASDCTGATSAPVARPAAQVPRPAAAWWRAPALLRVWLSGSENP